MIFHIPFPQILKAITIASAITSQYGTRVVITDIEDDNCSQSDESQKPVGACIADSRRCKAQSDTDDDRAGHNRRKESHNPLYADQLDDQCKNKIQETCNYYTACGIRKLLSVAHACESARIKLGYSSKSSEESK